MVCSPSPGCSASSQIVGKKPASVLPAPVAATSSALRPARARSSISSWCRRGSQPFDWNQPATTGGRRSVLDGIGSVAAPPLLFGIEVARSLLGAACLACRSPAHHQPDEHDQEDDRADDLHDPKGRFVHWPFLPKRELAVASPI